MIFSARFGSTAEAPVDIPAMSGSPCGLCLDPHDLAIAKYVAGRPKDVRLNRQLVARSLLDRQTLMRLLAATRVDQGTRSRIEQAIAVDFSEN